MAELIANADSDVRLAKGKFWNRCKHGTRENICDHFGWKYGSMKQYAMFADEISPSGEISFAHWRNACDSGALKEERPALLKRAVKGNWTPGRVTEGVKKIKEKRTGGKKRKPIVVDLTPEEVEKKKEELREEAAANAVPAGPEKMSQLRAFEVFGMGVTSWMSHRTFELIYRGLAKDLHPDKYGSVEEM